jgi:hypothetical protein
MNPLLSTVPVEVADVLVPVVEELQNLFDRVVSLDDARGLELMAHEGLKEIDRLFMETCVRTKSLQAVEKDVREVRCLHCEEEGWSSLLKADEDRYIVTVRGRVDYKRAVYRCTSGACRRTRAPFDEELGLEPKEHLSPLMQKKAAWAGTMLQSFEKAEQDMAHQVELPVSAKEIHRVTEKVGERALALQDEEARQWGRPAAWDHVVEPAERPETLVIEMDGTCVMGRDGDGHEVKCATVFGLDARAQTGSPGKERPVLLRRYYCATSKGIKAFRSMVWAMAVWWGVRSARRVVVIGDGIDWIWNFSADRFHFRLADGSIEKPVEILDFYHAAENLTKARNAIYRNSENPRAKEWYGKWKERLRQGKVEEVIEELEQRAKKVRGKNQREELRLRAEYFRRHAHRMRYPEFEAQDLPIGSGAIEGTCKNLIKGRMDCVGQRWDAERGIERMTALRVRLFNNRWNDLWRETIYHEAA